jgi:hypothetical protein
MVISRLNGKLDRSLEALRVPRDSSEIELNGVIASIVHLAYHLGIIRQIECSIRGPVAD